MDPSLATDSPVVATERRRSGRVDYQGPELIALLRQTGTDPVKVLLEEKPDVGPIAAAASSYDDLAPARGLLIGVVAAAPLWGIIGLLVWFFKSL